MLIMMPTPIFPNCALHRQRVIADDRGRLIALEGGKDLPFEIARAYFLFGTAAGVTRGFHAHKQLHQWAVSVSGSCVMTVDDGTRRQDIVLDAPELGLHVGPMIWHEMRAFSPDCVLLVLASAHYDEADYIRRYDAFIDLVRMETGQ